MRTRTSRSTAYSRDGGTFGAAPVGERPSLRPIATTAGRSMELAGAGRLLRWLPLSPRVNRGVDHPVAMARDRAQHRADQLIAEVAGLQAEIEQLGVNRVVVVLLQLDPRVFDVVDLYLDAK